MKRSACLLILCCSSSIAGTIYTVTALPFIATGINSSGQVIGVATPNGIGAWPNAPKDANQIPQQAYMYAGGGAIGIGLVGATASTVAGMNDLGAVVGDSTINGESHPYLYANGTMIDLSSALGAATLAGINDKGEIVGYTAGGSAFEYDGTTMTLLSGGAVGPSAGNSQPSNFRAGINTTGQIAASGTAPHSYSLNGPLCTATADAFVYSGGKSQAVGMPFGCGNSYGVDINDISQLLGQVVKGNNTNAFLENLKTGTATLLPTMGGNFNYVYGINDHGMVVGNSNLCSDPKAQCYYNYVATLYDNGNLINLNTFAPTSSGWVFYNATGINNNGDIVGYGTLNGVLTGFLLTAEDPPDAPEPGTWGLLTAGVFGLFVARKRKRLPKLSSD